MALVGAGELEMGKKGQAEVPAAPGLGLEQCPQAQREFQLGLAGLGL